jgi:phosphoribosylformylglycinamidine cyclo-ligase
MVSRCFSLARAVVFRRAELRVNDIFPGTRKTVAEVLLAVHKSYLRPVKALMMKIRVRGLAHITGGGFPDNLPRVLPKRLCAVVDRAAWKIPPLFQFIEEEGRVDREEMYRVFNMGVGMVVFVRPGDAAQAMDILREAGEKPVMIGRVEKGRTPVRLEN